MVIKARSALAREASAANKENAAAASRKGGDDKTNSITNVDECSSSEDQLAPRVSHPTRRYEDELLTQRNSGSSAGSCSVGHNRRARGATAASTSSSVSARRGGGRGRRGKKNKGARRQPTRRQRDASSSSSSSGNEESGFDDSATSSDDGNNKDDNDDDDEDESSGSGSGSGSGEDDDSDVQDVTAATKKGTATASKKKAASPDKLPPRAAAQRVAQLVKDGRIETGGISFSSSSSSGSSSSSDDEDGDSPVKRRVVRKRNGKNSDDDDDDSSSSDSSSSSDDVSAAKGKNSATDNKKGKKGGSAADAARDLARKMSAGKRRDAAALGGGSGGGSGGGGGGGGSPPGKRHGDFAKDNAGFYASSDSSSGDDGEAGASGDDRGSSVHGSVDLDDDLDYHGDVDVTHKEIDKALKTSRMTLNAKLNDLVEAHRTKLEALKTDSFTDSGGMATNGGKPGGNNPNNKNAAPKSIDMLTLDPVSFDDVGGVPEHIVALREMLLLPLMYPDLISRLGIKAPRGVLFCGPPGNGKTLMARALAHECSRLMSGGSNTNNNNNNNNNSKKKQNAQDKQQQQPTTSGSPVSFFARKGADIMCKWVGEGERQLTALFAEARRMAPSIIFFDEIDGLAPVRHMKQDSSHASVVSTLLALMDGLDDRGQVVVIGATNRPDTLDPALRRPGRFDRELRFDYPSPAARKHIISIHSKKWGFSDQQLESISERTHGYSGADLSALTAEASLVALRRFCPHMFLSNKRFDVDPSNLRVTAEDFLTAARQMVPSSYRGRNMAVLNDTPMRRCLGQSTSDDVLNVLRRRWHLNKSEEADPLLSSKNNNNTNNRNDDDDDDQDDGEEHHRVDTADAAASFLKTIRPPPVAGMSRSSAVVVFTVEHAQPATSAVEAMAACCPDIIGRAFPHHTLVASLCFASGAVAGVDGTLLDFESSGAASKSPFHMCAALLAHMLKAPDGTKAVLILSGTESLSTEPDEEADAPLRWLFDAVAHRSTAILIPTSVAAVKSHKQRRLSLLGASLAGTTAVNEQSPGVRLGDLDAALHKIIIPDMCASLLSTLPPEPPVVVEKSSKKSQRNKSKGAAAAAAGGGDDDDGDDDDDDLSPREKLLKTEQWQKVQYKRTQLRQLLRDGFMQLLSKPKFDVFIEASLDLHKMAARSNTASSGKEMLRKWSLLTKKSPISLTIVGQKIDDEKYTALSQFNDDVEQLVRHVNSFFSTDKLGQRYRQRVKQLKEEVLILNYRVNRSVALFCEDHADDEEPGFLVRARETKSNNNNNKSSNNARNKPGAKRGKNQRARNDDNDDDEEDESSSDDEAEVPKKRVPTMTGAELLMMQEAASRVRNERTAKLGLTSSSSSDDDATDGSSAKADNTAQEKNEATGADDAAAATATGKKKQPQGKKTASKTAAVVNSHDSDADSISSDDSDFDWEVAEETDNNLKNNTANRKKKFAPLPRYALRIRSALRPSHTRELRGAVRDIFKVKSIISNNRGNNNNNNNNGTVDDSRIPVQQSLNRCEQMLCFDLFRHERVRRIKAKLESKHAKVTGGGASPALKGRKNSSGDGAAGSSAHKTTHLSIDSSVASSSASPPARKSGGPGTTAEATSASAAAARTPSMHT